MRRHMNIDSTCFSLQTVVYVTDCVSIQCSVRDSVYSLPTDSRSHAIKVL